MNLKDKRIDIMLASKGMLNADIYYSPIVTWLIGLLLSLMHAVPLIIAFAPTFYGFLLIPYFLISYLLNAHHNNSFAFHGDKVIVVNPNFPFRRTTTININEIELVTIDERKRKWIVLFILFSENYLLIKTKNRTTKFYCSGLEMDSFGDEWTEKTIDDLDAKLKEKGIKTLFKLD